jgi:hypothetical protein
MTSSAAANLRRICISLSCDEPCELACASTVIAFAVAAVVACSFVCHP